MVVVGRREGQACGRSNGAGPNLRGGLSLEPHPLPFLKALLRCPLFLGNFLVRRRRAHPLQWPSEALMRVLGGFVAVLVAQAGESDPFYRFPRGTVWTYRQSRGATALKVVLTVVGEEGGKILQESKEYLEEGKEPKVKMLAWGVEEGFLVWGEFKGGKVNSPLRVYRPGSKKGDRWACPVGEGKEELEAVHLGTGEVKVPAGTYAGAVTVAFHFPSLRQERPLLEVVLVPKVGMVRFGGAAADVQAMMELTEFKEGR